MSLVILQYCILTGALATGFGVWLGYAVGYRAGANDAADAVERVLDEDPNEFDHPYQGVSP